MIIEKGLVVEVDRRKQQTGGRNRVGDRARALGADRLDRRSKPVVTAGPIRGGRARPFSVAAHERSAAYRSGCGRAAGRGAAAGGRCRPGLGDLRRTTPRAASRHAGPPIEPAAHVRPDARRARLARCGSRASPGTPAEALKLVEDGQIPLTTNHDAGGVGPMAGVVNPSMPVWVARDEATGKVAWCPLNEGSGAVLRYGADGPEVLERLKWMRDVLAPELRAALAAAPLDLYDLHVRSLALGDEAHHRTEEGTALTLEALGIEHPEVRAFIAGNGQFFLNLAMVFSKLALDCAADVPGSPVLTAIARNGVEVGIRVSGLGDQWFVGPAALPDPAKLFDGYTPADMNPDLGDSAIVETYGLGALAVAASPLAARLGRPRPGRRSTRIDDRVAGDRGRRVAGHPLSRTAARRSSASTPARSPRRGSRRPSTPGSRTGGPASARSAAASRTRRCRPSTLAVEALG